MKSLCSNEDPGQPKILNTSPAHAGDTGWIPGPGRFHIPWRNYACGPQHLKPMRSRACAPQPEKPLQWETWAPQQTVALFATIRENPSTATKTQDSWKKIKKICLSSYLKKTLSQSWQYPMFGILGKGLTIYMCVCVYIPYVWNLNYATNNLIYKTGSQR